MHLREIFKCANMLVTLSLSLNVRKIVEIVKMVIHYHVLRGYLSVFSMILKCVRMY